MMALVICAKLVGKPMKDILSRKLEATVFEDLIGETVESIRQVASPLGFWDDGIERICILCRSGKLLYLETDGGTNLFGFPGSQYHTVSLYKIKQRYRR